MPADPGFRRGDLVIAVFGRDHGKPRPAVVIQSDLFNRSHGSVVLCPISSDLTGFTVFRVALLHAETKGLRVDSEVMVDKMGAVERDRIRQRIGRLSPPQMSLVDQALQIWLDLPATAA
jgi:mRNA interferase MazF